MPDKKLSPEQVAANLEAVRYIPDWLSHAGITQRRLAEVLEISEGQVSKWLRGKATMSSAQFIKIAGLLGISFAQLSGPPDQAIRSELYKQVAEVIGELSEAGLRTILTVAQALRKSG